MASVFLACWWKMNSPSSECTAEGRWLQLTGRSPPPGSAPSGCRLHALGWTLTLCYNDNWYEHECIFHFIYLRKPGPPAHVCKHLISIRGPSFTNQAAWKKSSWVTMLAHFLVPRGIPKDIKTNSFTLNPLKTSPQEKQNENKKKTPQHCFFSGCRIRASVFWIFHWGSWNCIFNKYFLSPHYLQNREGRGVEILLDSKPEGLSSTSCSSFYI